jgi:hypothetical protein
MPFRVLLQVLLVGVRSGLFMPVLWVLAAMRAGAM